MLGTVPSPISSARADSTGLFGYNLKEEYIQTRYSTQQRLFVWMTAILPDRPEIIWYIYSLTSWTSCHKPSDFRYDHIALKFPFLDRVHHSKHF